MRRMLLLMAAAFILSCVKGYSQRVSFSGKDVQLTKVFSAIKSQTGYTFFYDIALLQGATPVTADLKNASLEEALSQILKDQSLAWLIEGKTITITRKPLPVATVQEANKNPLIRVSGTIMDDQHIPIPSASVMVKGKGTGTQTNENGAFALEINKGSVLIFSSSGYVEKQIRIEEKTLAIQLELDVKPMEKMVVGANIMAIKRKAVVSSVDVIDSKTLESLPQQAIDQIFRGVAPGANNIQPGYETNQYNYGSGVLSIRGSSGVAGYGIVKVYIDGIQFSGDSYFLSTLDKQNIDHIEVVKGPAASALYGSGAHGGVVLIYTKKAALNTTNINLTTSAGWYDSKWQDERPFRQLHSFNVAQGFKNISYYIGGNVSNNETYMPDGKQKRHTISGGVTYTAGNLNISVSGHRFQNNFNVERNAFWDTSSHPYFNVAGLKLPDTAQGILTSNVLGLNAGYRANGWWIHNLVIGWNDNFLSTESFAQNARAVRLEGGSKGPALRYYNTISFDASPDIKTTLLTGVEYSNILTTRYRIDRATTGYVFSSDTVNYQKNTGVFAQFNPSYRNKIFFTLAGRYEINKNFGTSFNPRIGVTTNFSFRQLLLKPRIAWGRGISSLSWPNRNRSAPPTQAGSPEPVKLKPTRQEGWDYGLEGYLANDQLSFEVARYDNIIKDMLGSSIRVSPTGTVSDITVNGGKVRNSGWEFSAKYQLRNLSISGNYSITNSILKEPVGGSPSAKDAVYPGEQALFIPEKAGGLTIGCGFPKLFGQSDQFSISMNITYTSGAYTTDNVRYTYDVLINRNLTFFNNYGIRYYKTQLPSITRLNLNLEYKMERDLRFFMNLSNMTNNTNPEYLNTFPSIGRGWMFGLKYNFSNTGGTGQ